MDEPDGFTGTGSDSVAGADTGAASDRALDTMQNGSGNDADG